MPATKGHVCDLWPIMRGDDVLEVWMSNNLEPAEALRIAFETTPGCLALQWVNGGPIAMFGCSRGSSVLGIGVPWLLASDDIREVASEFLRQSRPYIRDFFDEFRVLQNYVSVKNRLSVRWLKWCGFSLEGPVPYGPDEEPFYKFSAERGDI